MKRTKELWFALCAMLCMCALIVLTSFVNAGLDFEKMFTKDNLSNMLINAVVTVFGTIVALPAGTVATKQRVNADGTPGRYLYEFSEYSKARKSIEDRRGSFSQWHNKQHRQELTQKQIDFLVGKGVVQAKDVLKLSVEQVKSLTTAQRFEIDGKELYMKALTEEQIAACIYVLSGKVKVKKLPDFYFLYVDGKSSKTFYEQAYYETVDENFTLIVKLLYRIFVGFVITCILTGLVVDFADGFQDPNYAFRAIIIAVARILNAILSTFWGWMIGQELVYKQCYYLNGRTQFLKLFASDSTFKPKDAQELAKEEYEATKGEVLIEPTH